MLTQSQISAKVQMQQAAIKKPPTVTPAGGGANWNASGSWGAGDDDDGGWSKGPPASGSGWTAVTAAANGLSEWQNSSGANSDWQQVPTSQSIIVDRNDKEAWPSIGGDHSETASENDNASVKSESVISVSSSFGQGQENSSSGSSAIQAPNSSSLWSSNSNLNGLDPWDFGISTASSSAASLNSVGWSSANPSLSKNNQGSNMQSITSIAVSSNSSNPLSTSSKMSAGWGIGAPGSLPQGQNPSQGGNRPQTSVQIPQSLASSIGSSNGHLMQGSLASSGAQPNGPQMSSPQPGSISSQASSGQGSSAFQNISKSASDSWGSVGSAVGSACSDVSGTGKGNSGNNGQLSAAGGWDAPTSVKTSRSDGWPAGNPTTSGDWGNPSASGAQWGTQITPSRTGQPPQWGLGTAVPTVSRQDSNPPRSQTTWAQAAGKGLATNPSNTNTSATAASMPSQNAGQDAQCDIIASAIENHDGWGQRPVRQDTKWEMENSHKANSKVTAEKPANPVANPNTNNNNNNNNNSNMWNNNNGTAIWESNKEAAASSQWKNNSDPNSWAGPPKPPTKDAMGNTWGGNQPKENTQSSQWGAKTETGSWGNAGEGGSMSTWGEGQGQRRPGEVDDGTALWGNPSVQKPATWNNPTTPNPPNPPRSAQPGGGWGEAPPPTSKFEDGTCMWQTNIPQQPGRPSNWGGDPNQWNAAVGGPKPKPPSTSSWGDEWNPSDRKVRMGPMGYTGGSIKSSSLSSCGIDGDMYWNNPPNQAPGPITTFNWGEKNMIWNHSDNDKDDMVWNDDGSSNWDDTDMGNWNDVTQENNSSWSSAAGWKNGKKTLGINNKFPGGFQPPPQMRSRMLQQLMEMGFGKDEAQHALINNNMNFQSALEELYKSKGANFKRDSDLDVFQVDGAKPKLPGIDMGATDDISDTHSESNPYVPNINSMQNTPFPNAQSQIPNQFIANNMKGPSLTQSSQNINNSSIMPQQQRLIQEKFKHQQNSINPPPPGPPPSGQVISGRGPLPTPGQQQQLAQQQILQQLHLAVKAGLISPQLLNQQLPPPMLVMLQQLLQHQQLLQSLITTQQLIQQNKMGQNPMIQRQQLEQVNMKVNTIKQQILLLQRQISEAQRALIKPQQSVQPHQPEVEPISNLAPDLHNLAISTSQPQQPQQPPQSKLNQWRKGSDSNANANPTNKSADLGMPSDTSALNKVVGSKPAIHQSSSTPNLRYGDFGLSNIVGGDPTWSNNSSTTSSATTNWPSTIGTNASTSTISEEPGKDTVSDSKESQSEPATSSAISSLSDSIPEFVPGKPWPGITNKSVEDDPHMTPGSYCRSFSLSVSTVKDDYLQSLTKTSPTVSESQTWNPKGSTNSKWSTNDSVTPTSFSNEVWGVPLPKSNRPPPGLLPKSSSGWSGGGGVSRQHSWAGSSSSTVFSGSGSSWDSRISSCLILKNLTPQIDGSTLRTLCMQHGPLQWFYLSLPNGQALVRYHTKEEAFKAQKSLNTCVLGNTTIVAEFVSENEANRFVEQSAMAAQPPSQWSQQSNSSGYRQGSGSQNGSRGNELGWNASGAPVPLPQTAPVTSFQGSMWGHGGGLLGGDDTSASALLGNMLGETM